MKFLTKHFLISLVGCAFLLLLSACGGSTTGGQDTGGVGGSSSTGSNDAASTATAATATFGVKIANVDVKGKKTLVLTNEQGFTLYTFKPDTATKTACTGACAKTWPPMLVQQAGQVQYKGVGSLSAIQDANGIQVQANDHFVYTFIKDHAPGDANGQGVAGKWFVATPMNG